MELPDTGKTINASSEVIAVKMTRKLLPVTIMAHNEEKVIRRAVESVLSQDVPSAYTLNVIVVANGCNDKTEEIVQGFAKTHPETVRLISMTEKGKTKALNEAIKLFEELSKDVSTPYIVFLDADCQFIGKKNLTYFVQHFEQNHQLCAVGADCLPDVLLNSRTDLVAQIYRAVYDFGTDLKVNSVSGMCYGIRLDALRRVDFPNFQFAEDMYVCSRVNGRFLKDAHIRVVYGTPPNLRSEIKRRTRQEISTQRYHEYYSHLKSNGVRVRLFETSLGRMCEWGRTDDVPLLKVWIRQKDVISKFLVLVSVLIRQWARTHAYFILKRLKRHKDFDYWKVQR